MAKFTLFTMFQADTRVLSTYWDLDFTKDFPTIKISGDVEHLGYNPSEIITKRYDEDKFPFEMAYQIGIARSVFEQNRPCGCCEKRKNRNVGVGTFVKSIRILDCPNCCGNVMIDWLDENGRVSFSERMDKSEAFIRWNRITDSEIIIDEIIEDLSHSSYIQECIEKLKKIKEQLQILQNEQ